MPAAFRIVAIPTEIVDEVRASGKAPRYGHPTHTEVASGHGPCRHCLRTFDVGSENRILFTYDPFTGLEDVPLPGPVFIHAERCERYAEDGGYPAELQRYSVVLQSYSKGQNLVDRRLVSASDDKTTALNALLQRPEVDYVEVRDGKAGCFDFRVERAAEGTVTPEMI